MGSSQSKPLAPVVTEKLAERLEALDVEENNEKDYVCIHGQSCRLEPVFQASKYIINMESQPSHTPRPSPSMLQNHGRSN